VFGFADEDRGWKSPFGGPGSQLWVRECWATDLHYEQDAPSDIAAKAEEAGYTTEVNHPAAALWYRSDGQHRRWGDYDDVRGKWRPSIHMPKWACRTFLKVRDVRVERIQDISEADCWDEGISRQFKAEYYQKTETPAHAAFATLWDTIYAAKGLGWNDNPRVWVGTFREGK
jgi:hypothetical protein